MSPVLVGCLRRCRAASLVAIVLATILGLPPGAGAEEPLRPIAADQTSVEVPPGWKSIDRTTYDEYAAAVASGRLGQTAGGLDRCDYQFKLLDDGSLEGTATGTMELAAEPAWLPLGRPSFAISEVRINGEVATWGADPQGITCLWCPRDKSQLKFQCSQQGIRRGESLEFTLEWPTAVATSVELTVPAGMKVETQGLLKSKMVNGANGTTLAFQAGARSTCTIRLVPKSESPAVPFGMDLRQTVSASSTKVLIQSVVGILSPTAGPAVAEVAIPPGFTLLRANLGGDERLPIERSPESKDHVRLPLGELAAGQRVELRLVLERPADWSRPFTAPRVVPRNGRLLREEWILQVEKLELAHVDAPDYVLTSLTAEPGREVWTYQGTSANGTMTLTARAPAPEWTADSFVKRRQQGPRTETLTLFDLRSIRTPLYEFDVEILKPWKIVSVTAPDGLGSFAPLSFRLMEESETAGRHRILLRTPATPQTGTTVTITCAAQSEARETARLRPIARPVGGSGDAYFVVSKADELELPGADLGPVVPLTNLRSALRTNPFFEPVRANTSTIRRAFGARSTDAKPLHELSDGVPLLPPVTAKTATPALPFKDAHPVAELHSLLGTAHLESSHRAVFVFGEPVDASGLVVGFEGDWTFVEALCDGAPVGAIPLAGELRFPRLPRPVREITIRYSTPTAVGGFPYRERIVWPQLPLTVQRWIWRIDSPAERSVTEVDAPSEFVSGLRRSPLRERLLAPLGRAAGVAIFNPFSARSWREALTPIGSAGGAASESSPVTVTGRKYPVSTSLVAWSAPFLESLNWVLLVGAMLGIVILRRFRRSTFRFAASLAAIAATCACLLPSPFSSMAGAILCGHLFAYCIPRRLLAPTTVAAPRPAGSSMPRLAGATALLIALISSVAVVARTETLPPSTNVILLQQDGQPGPLVLVSEAVDADITAWQRGRLGPSFLIRGARYDIQVDDSDLAVASLDFDLVVPRPDITRSIQLPFEGLTFRGPDAIRINSLPARLVPTADGSGMILALPDQPSTAAEGPATYRVEMQAGVRIPAGGARREFALTMPRCNAAVGVVHSSSGPLRDFRSSARGRTQAGADEVTCALGSAGRWQARWRTSDLPERSSTDPTVTGRAESVLTAYPQSVFVQTRLIIETPELADPFAATRLELELPPGSIVSSVVGQSLVNWRTRIEKDAVRLLLDFTSPPVVGQLVDLSFELPIEPAATIEVPPIPLLDALSSHQYAIVTTRAFQLEMLSKPDPDSGLWAVEPSEASFSLRRDRGLPIPGSAIELEWPQPVSFALTRRPVGRTAELEQSMTSGADSISWTGTARVETSVWPGFLYEFRIDPAVEISSASVIERDVERLSRFVRNGERLLLIVGDDRLGTKRIRLDGKLKLEAGKVRPTPLFDLDRAIITRHECVVTSSADQLLQIRRRGDASLLVGGSETEWEPLVPSSRRIVLPTGDSGYEMRWINPASPLKLVEFLQLPADPEAECTIEWQLESSQTLPATLGIDAPHGTVIDESSDFAEEGRRVIPSDRVRIDLQLKSSGLQQARLRMSAPMHSSIGGNELLPHLADLSVAPVTYLAIPRSLLPSCDVPGDFLDQLPTTAPAAWAGPFTSRDLLVFMLPGTTWRVTTTGQQASVAEAAAEVVSVESEDSVSGQTRLTISPLRVGVLRIEPAAGGTLSAVRGTSGALLERTKEGVWQLLLRPSQPVAIIADWIGPRPKGTSSDVPTTGIVTPGLDVRVSYFAHVPSPEASRWSPEILDRPATADLLAAARLEQLLTAARRLPIGARPPAWLRDELITLSRAYRGSAKVGPLAIQAETLIDSWTAQTSTTTAASSVAPEASLVNRPPEEVLAEGMFVAAADPNAVVEVPAGRSAWSMPRRAFNGAFISAWIIFWAFLVTKGGEWSTRHQLADRLAAHPGAGLLVIAAAWWLLLAPSVFGPVLAAVALSWEAALFYQRRRLRPAAFPASDVS